jgi:hypothetical protein
MRSTLTHGMLSWPINCRAVAPKLSYRYTAFFEATIRDQNEGFDELLPGL